MGWLETTRERARFEGQLCRVHQTGPPALAASPYYYCHDKRLAPQSVAKSGIPLFPPPGEALCGFFHRLPDCSACGGGELGRRADLFSASYQLLCCCPAGAPGSLSPRLLSSPPSSSSQHLKQQERRVNFQFLFSIHFQVIYILDTSRGSSHSQLSKNYCPSRENSYIQPCFHLSFPFKFKNLFCKGVLTNGDINL